MRILFDVVGLSVEVDALDLIGELLVDPVIGRGRKEQRYSMAVASAFCGYYEAVREFSLDRCGPSVRPKRVDYLVLGRS